MMRAVVNVATGHYAVGQERLGALLAANHPDTLLFHWKDRMPAGCPDHHRVPYAFKAFAMKEVAGLGCKQLLWADSCIVPAQSLEPIWEHAREHGVWLSRNGWWNAEWTAESAYADLGVTKAENWNIPHVVATTFAVDLDHANGRAFLDEYFRLASDTKAFCGPWTGGIGVQHRHDQTAASVVAWRLGLPLTDPPAMFAYKGGETDKTVLIADGADISGKSVLMNHEPLTLIFLGAVVASGGAVGSDARAQ
jgi:hypothetical protein